MDIKITKDMELWLSETTRVRCDRVFPTRERFFNEETRKYEVVKDSHRTTKEGTLLWDVKASAANLGGDLTIVVPMAALPDDIAEGDEVTFEKMKLTIKVGRDGVVRFDAWAWGMRRYSGERRMIGGESAKAGKAA